MATAKRHYDASAQKMEQGFKVAQNILGEGGVDEAKQVKYRRRPYTKVQTELVETYFDTHITDKTPSTTTEVKEFLELHTTLTDRTAKDIIDKVRSIIRRNK